MDKISSEKLMAIGLSEKEALIYLTTLEHGVSSIVQLSQMTGIKRSTVYTVLDRLISQGLIHTETVGVKKNYAAEDPEKLKDLLDNKQIMLDEMLPELSAMFQQLKGSDSFIKHFHGISGVRTVYRQLLSELKPNDEYFVISDVEKWLKMDEKFFRQYLRRRAKLQLDIRVILQSTQQAKEHFGHQSEYNFKVKLISKHVNLTSTIVIVPHKIIFTQTVSPYLSIVVENKSLVQTHQAIFQILWNS